LRPKLLPAGFSCARFYVGNIFTAWLMAVNNIKACLYPTMSACTHTYTTHINF